MDKTKSGIMYTRDKHKCHQIEIMTFASGS